MLAVSENLYSDFLTIFSAAAIYDTLSAGGGMRGHSPIDSLCNHG